jgi:hypothetical protein
MDYHLENTAETGLVVTALLIINQILKSEFGLASKWTVLINLVAGIGANLYLNFGNADPLILVLQGLLMGASAGGVYSVKYLFAKEDPSKPRDVAI